MEGVPTLGGGVPTLEGGVPNPGGIPNLGVGFGVGFGVPVGFWGCMKLWKTELKMWVQALSGPWTGVGDTVGR